MGSARALACCRRRLADESKRAHKNLRAPPEMFVVWSRVFREARKTAREGACAPLRSLLNRLARCFPGIQAAVEVVDRLELMLRHQVARLCAASASRAM